MTSRTAGQRQPEAHQREEDAGQGIQPGPGEDPGGLGRKHDEDFVAGHRSRGIDPTLSARVRAVPDVGPVQPHLVPPAGRQDGKGLGVGFADVAAACVGKGHVGMGRQRRVGDRRLQAGQRDHRGKGPVEVTARSLGADGGQHRGLGGGGCAAIARDHQLIAPFKPLEPGLQGAQWIEGNVPGRAGDPPAPIKPHEVFVTGDAPGHLGQPVSALVADRPRRQGLQQDAGAFHAAARSGRAAFRSETQVLTKGDAFAVECDRRLDTPQNQHRQQGGGERRGEADPDRTRRTPRKAGHGAGPITGEGQSWGRPVIEGLFRPQRTVLSRSASARMARIASPADAPSRS